MDHLLSRELKPCASHRIFNDQLSIFIEFSMLQFSNRNVLKINSLNHYLKIENSKIVASARSAAEDHG